jgi:O-antigen ligase/lipopolysaccharide biosynthesis regulator YciM
MAVSTLRSINAGDALGEFLRIAVLFLFLFTSYFIFQKQQNLLKVLSRGSLLAIAVFSGYGSVQLFPLLYDTIINGVALKIDLNLSSSLANKNFFSEVMVMMIPLLAIGIYQEKKSWKLLFRISMLITLGWIVLLQSTAGLIAIIVSALLIFLFSDVFRKHSADIRSKNSKRKKIFVSVLSMVGILILVIFLSGSPMLNSFKSKSDIVLKYIHNPSLIDSTGNFNNNSVFERILVWRNSVRMVRDHPLIGTGLNNWKLLQAQYGIGGTPFINSGLIHFEHPHNDYLLVLAEQGPVGLMLYIAFFIFLLVSIYRTIRRSAEKDKKIVLAWMAFGILSFMLMSFFGYPRSRYYVMLVLMMYAALIFLIIPDQKKELKVSVQHLRLLFLSCFLLAFTGTVAAYYRMQGEIHSKEILKAQFANNYARMIRETDKAESLFYPIDHTATPFSWYRGMAHFYSGDYKGAVKFYEEAIEMNPYHLRILNDLATAYEKTGQSEKAISMYHKALKVAPYFTESLLNLSATYYNTGQLDSALTLINKIQTQRISYRDNRNYENFLKAILLAKTNNSFTSVYAKEDAQVYMNAVVKRDDILKMYKASDQNFDVFFQQLKKQVVSD